MKIFRSDRPRIASRFFVLVPLLFATSLAQAPQPGPRAMGAGAFPVTFTHTAAWFARQEKDQRKVVLVLVYFEGNAGWHNQRTDFKWQVIQSPARIEMSVGKIPILVKYWPETQSVEIQGTKFTLSDGNVFLAQGIDQGKATVRPLSTHNLSFPADEVPATALLKRDPSVWAELSGQSPEKHWRSHRAEANKEVVALDTEGLRLLLTKDSVAERKGCELFRQAALKGYAGSQYRLGYCYESGRGEEQNFSTANEWYEKAAKQGYVDAQYKLGHSYRVGRGTSIDLAAALEWYKKAAENGDVEGMHNVGWMYATGQGTKANAEEAYRWFLKAAEHGEASAQFEVARRLRDGDGITRDLTSSYAWLLVLSAQKDKFPPDAWEQVTKTTQSVASELDKSAIARAENQARDSMTIIAKHQMESFARQ